MIYIQKKQICKKFLDKNCIFRNKSEEIRSIKPDFFSYLYKELILIFFQAMLHNSIIIF